MTQRERALSILLVLILLTSLGYAVSQSLQFVGRAGIVGVFQVIPPDIDITPLEFTPELFNIGIIQENQITNYTLLVMNPNDVDLNITWSYIVNQTIPLMVWMFLDNSVFPNGTFREIGSGQTLSLIVQVEPGICDASCPVAQDKDIPFFVDLIFSGIAGPAPVPIESLIDNDGTNEPMEILNARAFSDESGIINYSATIKNVSQEEQRADVIVRLQEHSNWAGPPEEDSNLSEVFELNAHRMSLVPNEEREITGTFNNSRIAFPSKFVLQFEVLSRPPPGSPLAERVQIYDIIILPIFSIQGDSQQEIIIPLPLPPVEDLNIDMSVRTEQLVQIGFMVFMAALSLVVVYLIINNRK